MLVSVIIKICRLKSGCISSSQVCPFLVDAGKLGGVTISRVHYQVLTKDPFKRKTQV